MTTPRAGGRSSGGRDPEAVGEPRRPQGGQAIRCLPFSCVAFDGIDLLGRRLPLSTQARRAACVASELSPGTTPACSARTADGAVVHRVRAVYAADPTLTSPFPSFTATLERSLTLFLAGLLSDPDQ